MKRITQYLTLQTLIAAIITSVPISAAVPVQEELVKYLQPKLNSDRIEYFFGSYGVDTLTIDSPKFPNGRFTNLYSIHNGQKITRTLAIVEFQLPVLPHLQKTHAEIQAGKSIGIALREAEFSISKQPVFFGEIAFTPQLAKWMQQDKIDSPACSIHCYQLRVSNESKQDVPYCTITEIHSSHYLDTQWLKALYPNEYSQYSTITPAIEERLDRIRTFLSTSL